MYKIGEKVVFLYEPGFGIIKEILANSTFRIEDENGFEQIYHSKNLVKIHGSLDVDLGHVIKEDELPKNKSNYSIIKDYQSSENANYWELDLHIESIVDNSRGMSNYEILKIQMSEFKKFFSKAKSHRIPKIVLIHGVGEGVLKNEIRTYLSQQDHLEFYDASYLEYGKGATEVRIYYNV